MLRKRLTKLKMALTLFTLRLSGRSQNRMLKLPVSGWIIFTAALFSFTSINCEQNLTAYTFQ
jgi:hypothetical protein